MPTVDVLNLQKKKVGTLALRDDVFAAEINIPLVHQVIKAQNAGRRQGTAKTKTKSEVRGGGRKPYRQKGTGNARQGSIRSPLKAGGGQSFGPVPRSYEQATPKEMVRGALRSALSDRVKAGRVLILDEFKFDAPKTRPFSDALGALEVKGTKVLVIDGANRNLELSGRNVAKVKVLRVEGLNVYDIVRHDWVLLSKAAVETVHGQLATQA